MNTTTLKTALLASAALGLASAASAASLFGDFTPVAPVIDAGSLPEDAPFVFGNAHWVQESIADRETQLAKGEFNSGNWDMQTLNETGPDAGRFLFAPFETGQSGIQRTDLDTGETVTIWSSPADGAHVRWDASRWTPWGSYLTAEESWSDPGAAEFSPYGRLYEVTNPLAAPQDIKLIHRNILPRVSHEGLAFDEEGNLYFIDERNDSHIYKYTSTTPGTDSFFDKGQSFVLRVGDGTEDDATGPFTWVPITDAEGNPLPGAVTGLDPNGVPVLDGRATPNLPQFLGTNYDRPEDLEIKTLADGTQLLFVAATTTDAVFALNLTTSEMSRFADRDTIDDATGLPVGSVFNSPDNLAIDADGTIYIIEDQSNGTANIWRTIDADGDGVAESMAVWATLATAGAEPTGLYFDPFRPDVAYVNIQHPASGNDRTIRITAMSGLVAPVPLPATGLLLAGAVGALALRRRR